MEETFGRIGEQLTGPWPYSHKKINSSCRTDFLMSHSKEKGGINTLSKEREKESC